VLRIPANTGESPGTSKTLARNDVPEKLNDIKGPKTASQAYDEGSIPFTRSNQTKHFLRATSAALLFFGTIWHEIGLSRRVPTSACYRGLLCGVSNIRGDAGVSMG
jgi:hypothetical protein